MSKFIPSLVIFAAVCACTTVLHAETNLGEIVVSDDQTLGTSLSDQSAFVTIIRPEDYKGEYTSTAELLNRSVGVHIIDYGGLGQQQAVSIRGSSPEQVVVLLDGVRLNSAQQGGVDIATIPVQIIDHMEVMRGGEAALYGTDAIGGVVNIITKKGAATKDNKPKVTLSGTFGSFETYEASGTISGKIDSFDYFASETHFSSKGDFPFLDVNNIDTVRINNESISEAPFIRLGLDVANVGRFEISDQFFWTQRGQPGFGSSQLAFAESTNYRNLISLRFLRNNFIWDSLNFEASVFHQMEDTKFEDPMPRIGPPIESDTKPKAYGGKIQFSYLWKPFQLLTFTTEVREDTADVYSNSAVAVNFQNFSVDRFTYAFVLRDEIQLFDDRLAILPSFRFEDSTTTQGEPVPKLGIRYKPWKFLALKGNIGKTFRIPNFDELYFPESESIGGNPFLVPEEGYSGDAGFEILTKPFFFSLAAYYTKTNNAIFFVPISATRIEPLNFQDPTISQGFEVSAQYDPIEYLSLTGNYTFLDCFFQGTQYILPGRSRHDAHARATFKWAPWVRVYVEGHYLSEFSVVLSAAGGQLEPGRLVMNTGVSVTPVDFMTLAFEVKDVNDARGINDNRDYPMPERRYFGTVTLNF